MTSLQALLEQSQRLQSTQTQFGHHHHHLAASSSVNANANASSSTSSTSPSAGVGTNNNALAFGSMLLDHQLPIIQLGLDQIESQSRRIAAKSLKQQASGGNGGNGNAAFLLAHGGVNADQLQSTVDKINLTGTFEPLLPLNDTDVEGFLRHTHEQTIISSIEEGRRATTSQFYKNLDSSMRKDWESQKEKLFDELGRHHAASSSSSSSTSVETPRRKAFGATSSSYERGSPITPLPSSSTNAGGSLQMHSRMMRYDRVVRKLNEFRKEGFAFGLIASFSEASVSSSSTSTSTDSKANQTTETWRLLSHLVQERDVLNGEFQRKALQEREYAQAYLMKDQDANEAVQLRKMLTDGARQHLEEQFMNYVEKLLASRPTEAGLGGVPSLQNKIRAFLNLKYQKNGQWTNSNLEIANNTPIWARIYYLLRAGHSSEALAFATENEAAISKLEKSFVAYLKAWLDSSDRRLPKLLRDRFLSEYNQRIRYSTDTSDPYKHALYKLIGRVEINRRNVAGVTQTTEDWLWFQLSLVRESTESNAAGGSSAEAPHEKYGLRDLAKVLVRFGENHFDPKGNKPMLYFQVLLLSGQFERAIAFLHQHAQFQTDAVHFAIALAYYGLLRIPTSTRTSEVDLLVVDSPGASGYEQAQLHFARLLHRYTRSFAQTDTDEALHYLYLICLNADLPGSSGSDQVKLCHDYIRELVMETRKYSSLLGDVRNDGTKIPGQIERDLKLIHLKDERAYLLGIVKSAAHRADQEKRFSEAILLYNLADEYDAVISVLNAELGQALARPNATSTRSNDPEGKNGSEYYSNGQATIGLATASGFQEDIAQVARSILDHYDRAAGGMGGKISRKNRETCEILLRLKQAMTLYERDQFENALQLMEEINLVPLQGGGGGDLVGLIRAADEFKELDESILRNFDLILLTIMNLIYKLHQALKQSPFGDAARQQRMNELRQKARSVMMFAGMSRFRLTNETYAQLTRLDVFIH